MSSMGEKLRALREKKDISLDLISEKTNLKKDFILALEEEKLDRLPTIVHAKGFLKTYVQFLGGSFESFLEEFDELIGKKQSGLSPHLSSMNSPKMSASSPETGFAVFKNFLFRFSFSKTVVLGSLFLFCVLFLLGKFLIFSISWGLKNRSVVTHLFKKKVSAPQLPKQETKLSISHSKKSSQPVSKQEEYFVQKDQPLRLNVLFLKKSWISVKVDGDLLYEGFVKKGLNETWTGLKQLSFRVDEAKNIVFRLNGKPIEEMKNFKDSLRCMRITHRSIEFE